MNNRLVSAEAPDDRLPRYQQVRDDLVRRIAGGEWAPEQAIPTEAALAQTYAVSVGTVRKAIDQLVADGIVTRSQGRGTFVRRPRFDTSMFRFFRFKSRSGEPVLPVGRVLRRELAAPDETVRAALRLAPRDKAIHLSRVRLVDGQTVIAEEIWLPREGFEPLAKLALPDFGDLLYPLYERLCGQVVATASETLTVGQADADIAALLRIAPASPIIVVHRTAFDFAGKPLEWRFSRGAAAAFQYEVEIR